MRRLAIAAAMLFAVGLLGFGLLTRPNPLLSVQQTGHAADPANGRTVFFAGGCASCHAAPGAKGSAKLTLAGGLELKTPFGVFVVPNISPDPQAGIGGWTDTDFVNAMTRGLSPDGRHYYPAFPYASYQHMTLVDLVDLKAFLDTLPRSDNVARDHDLKFPYSFRRGLGLWKLAYLDGRPFRSDPDKSDAYNRGAYLVKGPGHCGECHTSRDRFGGTDFSAWLAGAPLMEGKGFVPNLTPHADGLKTWSKADIAYYLETGFTPDFDSVGGAMVAVQENTAQLPARDRQAIATYLSEIPALAKPEQAQAFGTGQ